MAALRHRVANPLRLLKHRPWRSSTAIAPRLHNSQLVEEELAPYYDPSRFYPARLGEVLNGRYQLATKLGHGASSTVWLARDLNHWLWLNDKYVAVKVNANVHLTNLNAARAELSILDHISTTNPRHQGWQFIRHPLDSFTLENGSETHLCLVSMPLRKPLWLYQDRFHHDALPSNILKVVIQMVIQGLNYPHSECRVIHTHLKPDNIMVKLEVDSILRDSARDEYEHPLPQKACEDGRTTDFDCAVRGDQPNNNCIQAGIYRAPEVIVDAGFSYNAEICVLGVMFWDLLEGKELFPFGDDTQDDDFKLLGPPPQELIRCGRRSSNFYRSDGSLKNPDMVPTNFNLDTVNNNIHGEDKRIFTDFVKRMIKWRPDERSTAKELLDDPWLYADFP